MKTSLLVFAAAFAISLFVISAEQEGAAPQQASVLQDARAAVQRSLPYIEKTSKAWMVEKKCNSCHVVTFHVWGHTAAATRGLDVDREKLADSVKWALADSLSDRRWFGIYSKQLSKLKAGGMSEELLTKLKVPGAKNFPKEKDFLAMLEKAIGKEELEKHKALLLRESRLPNNGGGPDTLAQLLLGLAPTRGDTATKDSYDAVQSLLLEWQEPDGSWLAQGQLPSMKWDGAKEMHDATTMWSLLAVSADNSTAESLMHSRQRALEYLKTSAPGKTVQTLALHLIVAHRFGETGRADALRGELLGRQNEDGGWSWWKEDKSSDAFATGQALYALGSVGRDGNDTAVRKAWQFLIQTQARDGSWKVPEEPITTHPGGLNVFTFWGASWAAIGIAETLPATENLPTSSTVSGK